MPVRPPALYLPPDACEAMRRIAKGLCDVFGFTPVTNTFPTLQRGDPLLLLGWRSYYCEAVARYPGHCSVVWPYGWAETEAREEGARLDAVLRHVRAGACGFFWSDLGDVLPEGVRRLPPVWRANEPVRGLALASDRVVLSSDASIGVVAGILAAGGVPCLPRSAVSPPNGATDRIARADALRALLADARHVLYDEEAPPADLHVCLVSNDAWPGRVVDAVQAGTPAVLSEAVPWAALLDDEIAEACVVSPAKSSAMVAAVVGALLDDPSLRERVLVEQQAALREALAKQTIWAREALSAAGFAIAATDAPRAPRLILYADTPGWAQHAFVQQLAAAARAWGDRVDVTVSSTFRASAQDRFYSPVARAADTVQAAMPDVNARGGLWSHVSYGGWFTDDPLDPKLLPKTPAHATNLYLHALTGLPYLAAGVDTDLFSPPEGDAARTKRHTRDRRIVVGWTGSLQYNAAVKLFLDLWIPTVREAGSDGALADAKFCARPLVVWDCLDARDPRAVARYLQDVDVYLCTSISEGCSLSVLEAAAAGCAIISTPCGNAPELASVIVSWNDDDIVNALRRYDEDRDRLYGDQERAREIAVRYWSWRAPEKQEAWRAWLGGSRVPDWQEQVPYCARGGIEASDYLMRSRLLREGTRPSLERGNMMGS